MFRIRTCPPRSQRCQVNSSQECSCADAYYPDDEAKAYASLLAAKLQYPDIGAVQLEKITGASLKKLTCPYNATLDSPTADFYVELADLYPESLVILTVRDTDKQWWSSWHSTLGSIFDLDWEGRLRRAVFWAAPNHASRLQMMMNYTLLWQSKYGEYGPQVHKQHNLEVARRIAPDRLLVFNVKEGWSPLCTFLGVKVPSEPFPHRYVHLMDILKLWGRADFSMD